MKKTHFQRPELLLERHKNTSDLVFICKFNQKVYANQFVLRKFSPFLRDLFSSKSKIQNLKLVDSKVEGLRSKLEVERSSEPKVEIMVPEYSVQTLNILLDIIYTGQSRTTGVIDDDSKQLEVVHLYQDLGLQPVFGLPEPCDLEQIEVLPKIKREEYFEEIDSKQFVTSSMDIDHETDKEYHDALEKIKVLEAKEILDRENTEKLQEKIKELTAKIDEEKNLNKTLEAKENLDRENIEKLQEKIKELTTRIDEEKNLNKTLEAKEILDIENIDKLQEKVKELTAMIDKEKNLNKTKTEKNQTLESEINELQTSKSLLENVRDYYSKAIKDLEAKNSKQKDKIQKLESEKNELKAKCDLEVLEKIKNLEAQENKEKENYQRFCETINGLKATYDNVMKEKEEELKQAKAVKERKEEDFQKERQELELKIVNLLQKIEKLDLQIQNMASQLSRANSKNASLETEVSNKNDVILELKNQLRHASPSATNSSYQDDEDVASNFSFQDDHPSNSPPFAPNPVDLSPAYSSCEDDVPWYHPKNDIFNSPNGDGLSDASCEDDVPWKRRKKENEDET